MSNDLWQYTNYMNKNDFLFCIPIYEYDIEKANISVLYNDGAITKSLYTELHDIDKLDRQKRIGIMQRNNPKLTTSLQEGIKKYRRCLFQFNVIDDQDVLSINNDAVFLINRKLWHTEFRTVNFRIKHTHYAFFNIHNLLYYYDSTNQKITIKGINKNKISLHENFMLKFMTRLVKMLERSVYTAFRFFDQFYDDYKNRNLPIEYYRTLDNNSYFRFIGVSNYASEIVSESDKEFIDISYNDTILLKIQEILIKLL